MSPARRTAAGSNCLARLPLCERPEIGATSPFTMASAKVGLPPTAADFCTIQDGPPSTLSSPSLQAAGQGGLP
jgi:hypothetical protein